MKGRLRRRRASLIVPLLMVDLMISGSLASYSNGKSRYQDFPGCNETIQQEGPPAPVISTTSGGPLQEKQGGQSFYQPVIIGPQETQLGNRIMTSSGSDSSSVGGAHVDSGYNRFTIPGRTPNDGFYDEEEQPIKAPSAASLLGASKLAQFRQSALAFRSQITGNRFFEPDSSSVKFTLYTRKNPQTGHKIQVHNRDTIESTEFAPDKPTKVIVHGFSEIGALGEWVGHLRDAYLSTSDANVIIADFSTFETFLLFWTNLPVFASKRIADLVTFLELTTGAPKENFHLIARSFGTHVAGVTGRMLQGKLGRITGLEPEPRVYGSALPDYRLMETDAKFVDIVRVNGRRYYFHGARFGLAQPAGHVDIYPNFSERNSGCPGRTATSYGRSNFAYCQRGRGVTYFTESIKYPDSHAMCQCASFTQYKNGNCVCTQENSIYHMGEYLNNQTRGVFQLKNAFANRNLFRGLRFFG